MRISMKVVMIHGRNHKGSTYQIAQMVAKKLEAEVQEFFLPQDFGEFCTGCTQCFMKDEHKCPHFDQLNPITMAMDASDVIILTSPVYVYHVTGAMKAWLDHYGYRWMVHRPDEKMFHKQAVCITTAAGGGMKSTIRDMKDSMFYWGIAKIHTFGFAVRAISFEEITEKRRKKIDKETSRIANAIKKNGKVVPGIKTKLLFFIMSKVQKVGWNQADATYWREKGWTGSARPWKER